MSEKPHKKLSKIQLSLAKLGIFLAAGSLLILMSWQARLLLLIGIIETAVAARNDYQRNPRSLHWISLAYDSFLMTMILICLNAVKRECVREGIWPLRRSHRSIPDEIFREEANAKRPPPGP